MVSQGILLKAGYHKQAHAHARTYPCTISIMLNAYWGTQPSTMSVQDDGYIPGAVDQQIFDTLAKIRKRDRSIYDSNTQFFEGIEEANAASQQRDGGAKKQRPTYLKDVIAQQVTSCQTSSRAGTLQVSLG